MKRVLVYGGKGALGSTVVEAFAAGGWWTLSVDMVESDKAAASIVVKASESLEEQAKSVVDAVVAALPAEDGKLDSIVCVAGGWAGGKAGSAGFVKSVSDMGKQSVWTSAIAAQLAGLHLREGGLLVLTGAVPSLAGTPGMIGYGMAKATVHQLTASLAAPNSGLPNAATALAILPVTLDTPMNRKFMADADKSAWTPLSFVAQQLLSWSDQKDQRPPNGSLVQLHTKDGQTTLLPKSFA